MVPFLFTLYASKYLHKGINMVYFIATIDFNHDKDVRYLEYIKQVVPIVKKYNGRYIVRSERVTHMSMDWKPDKVIIIEFDTKEHLEECFASEEYKIISPLRESSVRSNAIIVE